MCVCVCVCVCVCARACVCVCSAEFFCGRLRLANFIPSPIVHRVIQGLIEQRGEDDCWVLAHRGALGLAWQKQGRCADAEALWVEVLSLQEARGSQGEYAHVTRSRLHALRQGKVVGIPEPRWPGMTNQS